MKNILVLVPHKNVGLDSSWLIDDRVMHCACTLDSYKYLCKRYFNIHRYFFLSLFKKRKEKENIVSGTVLECIVIRIILCIAIRVDRLFPVHAPSSLELCYIELNDNIRNSTTHQLTLSSLSKLRDVLTCD